MPYSATQPAQAPLRQPTISALIRNYPKHLHQNPLKIEQGNLKKAERI